jgi:hypothetical protein
MRLLLFLSQLMYIVKSGIQAKEKQEIVQHVVMYQCQHISDNAKQIYKHIFYPLHLLWLSFFVGGFCYFLSFNINTWRLKLTGFSLQATEKVQ